MKKKIWKLRIKEWANKKHVETNYYYIDNINNKIRIDSRFILVYIPHRLLFINLFLLSFFFIPWNIRDKRTHRAHRAIF